MLHVGRRIGDFIIERELGRGGMGIVYSAVNEQTAERVAVKMLSPHLLPDPRQRRRFQREAYAAAQIQHDGLIRVISHGESEQAEPYIMMEYLDGASLRQALQAAAAGRFSIDAAVQIALRLADVLDSAHKSGLLHRDIKPSNVMLLGDIKKPAGCRVKLLDFGLARLLTEGEGVTVSEGDVIGTPAYMSPEQCEGRANLDGRSDVYGLGSLLFEMVCGRTPFQGPPPRLMYQHVYEAPPSPEKFCPELGGELRVLIMRMLAKEPDGRPTMSEVAWQLRSHSKQVDLPPPTPLQLQTPRMSDKARLWIGILCLINLALAVSLWRALSPGSAPVPAKMQSQPAVSSPPPPTPAESAPTPAAPSSRQETAALAPAPPKKTPVPAKPPPVLMPRRSLPGKSAAVAVPPTEPHKRAEVLSTAVPPAAPQAPPSDTSPAPPVTAPKSEPTSSRPKVEYWK